MDFEYSADPATPSLFEDALLMDSFLLSHESHDPNYDASLRLGGVGGGRLVPDVDEGLLEELDHGVVLSGHEGSDASPPSSVYSSDANTPKQEQQTSPPQCEPQQSQQQQSQPQQSQPQQSQPHLQHQHLQHQQLQLPSFFFSGSNNNVQEWLQTQSADGTTPSPNDMLFNDMFTGNSSSFDDDGSLLAEEPTTEFKQRHNAGERKRLAALNTTFDRLKELVYSDSDQKPSKRITKGVILQKAIDTIRSQQSAVHRMKAEVEYVKREYRNLFSHSNEQHKLLAANNITPPVFNSLPYDCLLMNSFFFLRLK